MRIVGGTLRGLKLAELGAGDAAAHLRPTTDRVREAIFNLLINGSHGNPLPGARVLDLFAGTGALGLEALSRGAARVSFVDDGMTAVAAIHDLSLAARFCDRLVLLNKGVVVAEGLPGDVLTPENIEAAFGVRAIVSSDPASGVLGISVMEPGSAGISASAGTRVHVVCGGGTGARRACVGARRWRACAHHVRAGEQRR